ncbi:MAG: beta strand repeat-containing protein [Labrys sp. (in: a-proteobacteria)]
METGAGGIGDDDKITPDLGGFAPFTGAPTFRLTSLPTFGTLFINRFDTNGGAGSWAKITAADFSGNGNNLRFEANARLYWVLTDEDVLPPNAATKPSFTYVAIDPVTDGAIDSAPATVTIDTVPVADSVLTGDDAIPTLDGFIDPATGAPYQILTFKKLDIGGARENDGTKDPTGAFEGGITVREPGADGDRADLGGVAIQSEDGLGFYLTSLPATGKLYYKGADQLGNGSGLTEITAANLLNASGSNLATALKLNTGQEIYWITTGADLTKQAPVTVGGQGLTLAQWENPTGGNGLTVDITAFGFDGQEGYIVTQNGAQGVKGSDGTTSGKTSSFVQGGMGIQGGAPNVAFQAPGWEAELGRGYGSYFGTSEKLRFAFSKPVAVATIQVSHLYLTEGELGVVDLFYEGRFVKSLTFGPHDAAISKVKPDLEMSFGQPTDTNGNLIGVQPGTGSAGWFRLDGYIFDTVEFTSLSDGLRFDGNSQFDPSDYYVDGMVLTPVTGLAPTATFDYKVADTEGRLSETARVIIDQSGRADDVMTTFGAQSTVAYRGESPAFLTFFDINADPGLTGDNARADIQDALIEQNSRALFQGDSKIVNVDIGAFNPSTGTGYPAFRITELPDFGQLNYVASDDPVEVFRASAGVQPLQLNTIFPGSSTGMLIWRPPVNDRAVKSQSGDFVYLTHQPSFISNPDFTQTFPDFRVYGIDSDGQILPLLNNPGQGGYAMGGDGRRFNVFDSGVLKTSGGQTWVEGPPEIFAADLGGVFNNLEINLSDAYTQFAGGPTYYNIYQVTLYRAGQIVFEGTYGVDYSKIDFSKVTLPPGVSQSDLIKTDYTLVTIVDTNGTVRTGNLNVFGYEFDHFEIFAPSFWDGSRIQNTGLGNDSDRVAGVSVWGFNAIGGQIDFKYQGGLQTGTDSSGNPVYGAWTDPATVTIGVPVKNQFVDYDYENNRVAIALADAGTVLEGGSLVYEFGLAALGGKTYDQTVQAGAETKVTLSFELGGSLTESDFGPLTNAQNGWTTATDSRGVTTFTKTVTLAAGDTLGSVSIPTSNTDAVGEALEQVNLKIVSVTNTMGGIATADGLGIGAIVEAPDASIAVADANPATVNEGQTLTYAIAITPASGLTYTPAQMPQAGVPTTVTLELVLTGSLTAADIDLTGWQSFVRGGVTVWRKDVVLGAGVTNGALAIPTKVDNVAEAAEQVTVTIAKVVNAGGGFTGIGDTGTGTIADVAPVNLAIANAPDVFEGGSLTFALTLSAPAGSYLSMPQASRTTFVTVELALSGTLTANDFNNLQVAGWTKTDNTLYTRTFAVPAGQTSFDIDLQTATDLIAEQREQVSLTITSATNTNGIVNIANPTGTGGILDVVPARAVIGDAGTVTEGGNFTFTVTLTDGNGGDYLQTRQASADGIVYARVELFYGVSSADYLTDADLVMAGWQAISVDPNAGTQLWQKGFVVPANQSTFDLVVATRNDGFAEMPEVVNLTIAGIGNPNGSFIIVDSTGLGTISDPLPAGITLADAATITEGGTLAFVVALTGPGGTSYLATAQAKTPTQVALSFTVALDPAAGLSVADLDNAALTGTGANGGWTRSDNTTAGTAAYTKTIMIAANTASTTVSIPTVTDALTTEATETLPLAIAANGVTNANGSFTINDGSGVGAITETTAPAIVVSNAQASANEGSPLVFVVGLDKPTATQLTYGLTLTDGTAVLGSDYTNVLTFTSNTGAVITYNAATNQITVPAGVSSFTVSVPTINDTTPEGPETLTLTVGGLAATGTILDNDPPVFASIANDQWQGGLTNDFLTDDPTLTINGLAAPNATVTLRVDVLNQGNPVLLSNSIVADGTGKWSYTVSNDATGLMLKDGYHAFTATAQVGGGPVSPVATKQVGIQAISVIPVAITDNLIVNGSFENTGVLEPQNFAGSGSFVKMAANTLSGWTLEQGNWFSLVEGDPYSTDVAKLDIDGAFALNLGNSFFTDAKGNLIQSQNPFGVTSTDFSIKVSQTIAGLTAGANYTLSFDMFNLTNAVVAGEAFRVIWNGTVLFQNGQFSYPDPVSYQFNVVAGATNKLTFEGGYIDNPQNPSAWADSSIDPFFGGYWTPESLAVDNVVLKAAASQPNGITIPAPDGVPAGAVVATIRTGISNATFTVLSGDGSSGIVDNRFEVVSTASGLVLKLKNGVGLSFNAENQDGNPAIPLTIKAQQALTSNPSVAETWTRSVTLVVDQGGLRPSAIQSIEGIGFGYLDGAWEQIIDRPFAFEPSSAIGAYSQSEIVYTVVLAQQTTATTLFDFQVLDPFKDSATRGQDVAVLQNQNFSNGVQFDPLTQKITVPTGVKTFTFEVMGLNDGVHAPKESFRIAIDGYRHYGTFHVAGSDAAAGATVAPPPPGTLELVIADEPSFTAGGKVFEGEQASFSLAFAAGATSTADTTITLSLAELADDPANGFYAVKPGYGFDVAFAAG